MGEESRSGDCNKGLLVGALEERRAIPVSELLEKGKKFPSSRSEARQVGNVKKTKEGAFCERVEGDGRMCQLSARLTVPGPGGVRASDWGCVCL